MLKRYRFLFIALIALALLPAAFVLFVATYDWNGARPWLQAHIGGALGRPVTLAGDVRVDWRWQRREGGESHWSPGLHVIAGKVEIGNPPWATRKHFAELDAIEVDLRLLPLLAGRVAIPSMRLVRPTLDFERRADGHDNWSFDEPEAKSASAWTLDLGEIEFGAGEMFVDDAERKLALKVQITALDAPVEFGQRVDGDDPSTRREVIQRVGRAAAERLRKAAQDRAARAEERGKPKKAPPPYLFAWKAEGTLAGAKVDGNGRFGGILSLKDADRPLPVRADVDVGATEIALTGTITDPTSPDAIDMRLWITGPNLAQLYPIARIAMPNTPPYAMVGRLTGHFNPHRTQLRYQDFSARVGGSDLAGTLTYRSGEPRGTLSGEVDSTLLQFNDLAALIGAGSAQAKSARGDISTQPADRVLPTEAFNVERWKAMDADVHFTGKRVIRDKELPIQDVDARIAMKAGVLAIDPLRFGMAGGRVSSALHIDANAAPPRGRVTLTADKLQLRRLFESVPELADSLGEVRGSVALEGAGRSIAALLGNADGSMKILMTDGRISEAVLEEAGLNLANFLLAKLLGDERIAIDCAAADFAAKDGVLHTNAFVIDTEKAVIDVDGTLSLRDEQIRLTLHPTSKSLRLFSLRSPLHVAGSFQKVEVGVDKKSLLLRGGGALGLGLVAAPLAALLPLISPGGDAEKSCAPLLQQLRNDRPNAGADAKKGIKKAPATKSAPKTHAVKAPPQQ